MHRLISILLPCLVSLAISGETRAAPRLRVGVIAPLTGPLAPWGNDVRNALLFARQRVGGDVEFIFEDDRCLGKEAQTAAQKVIGIDGVDFAIVVCSESLLTTAPLFERAGITVISPSATAASISRLGDFVFRTYPDDAAAARKLMEYIAQHHKRVGIVTELRGYAQELDASLGESLSPAVTMVRSEFATDDHDLRVQLLRLKHEKVEALILNPNSEERFVQVLRQVREVLGPLPVYGVHFPANAAFLNAAGSLAEGVVFVAVRAADSSLSGEGKDLLSSFVGQYGPMQSSDFVFASTFEAYRLVVRGSETQSGRGDIRNFLYNGKFDGLFGEYTFDRRGDVSGVGHGLYRISRGQVEIVP